jgi:actin-related protein 5
LPWTCSENPEQYLEELRTRYTDLTARAEQRKRKRRKSGSVSSLTGGAPGSLVLGGRGERLSAAQKERMRLLATAAFDGGKEEDTFGMRDEDWQLYKKMAKDGEEDEDAEEDDAELSRLEERLKVYLPGP